MANIRNTFCAVCRVQGKRRDTSWARFCAWRDMTQSLSFIFGSVIGFPHWQWIEPDFSVLHLNTGLLNIRVSWVSSNLALFKALPGSDLLTTARFLCFYRSSVDENRQWPSRLWILLAVWVHLFSEETIQTTLKITPGAFIDEGSYAWRFYTITGIRST